MQRVNTRQRANMTPDQYDSFRMNMRAMRKANHLSLTAFGDLLECSAGHLNSIELGKKYPSDALAKDVAEVFGVSVSDMCSSETEKQNNAGRELLEKRLARGFKINEVAGFLGTSREAYLDMESGKCNIADSIREALDRLYAVVERVETVEVVKEVQKESPISIWEIDKVLAHIIDMDIDVDEQKALFRKLSDTRTKMLETELFG